MKSRIHPATWLVFALICVACLLFGPGCMTAPVRLDNSARLVARPDFKTAAQAAPEWCRDALKTVNQLEYQLERK